MSYFVGAYAASPNNQHWDPELETRYYEQLKAIPSIKGLEHPFLGALHPHDDAWFVANIHQDWRFVFTCIPGVMTAMGKNPYFGLASDQPEGRTEALRFMRSACEAIAALNNACGKPVVDAIQIQTAPNKAAAPSSAAAFKQSLIELLSWDWQGARLVVEHCDTLVPGQTPAKGFLALDEEINTIAEVNAEQGRQVGILINWGRSAIETRSAAGALEHIQKVKKSNLLVGLMFSGVSDKDTPYIAWKDSHMPHAQEAKLFGAQNSLMTSAVMQQCLVAADAQSLPIVGLKYGIRPLEASINERVAYIKSGLDILSAAI
jgi:hypothetical protein